MTKFGNIEIIDDNGWNLYEELPKKDWEAEEVDMKITPDFGIGVKTRYEGETYTYKRNPRKKPTVTLVITSWRGISSGTIHYYGKLEIDMPEMDEDSVLFVLRQHFPDGEKSALKAFAGLFLDLQIKAYHGEISTKSLDLRGLVSAVKATRSGLSPIDAIQMGIINKSFDVFEKEIVEDVVSTRIPSSWTGKDIWG